MPGEAPAATSTPAAPADVTAAEPTLAATAALLSERFPALFAPNAVKPIKLRIQADIQQRVPGLLTRRQLSVFLHRHTTSTAYLKALVASPHRFDLDGQPAGEVAAEHRDAAAAEVERRRQIVEQRRAAEREARRAQHRPPRRLEAPRAEPVAGPAAPAAPGGAGTGRPPRMDRPPRTTPAGSGAGAAPLGERRPRTDRPAQGERGRQGPRSDRPGARDGGARARPPRRHEDDGRPARPGSQPSRPPRPDRDGPQADRPPRAPDGAHREAPEPLPEDPARRERALLLRAWESSPLTPSNFCALKGLKVPEFEAQIELARRERAERGAAQRRAPSPG